MWQTALAAALVLCAAFPAAAQIPTPEATALRTYIDDGNVLAIGFDAHPESLPSRIGIVAVCEAGDLQARMYFGGFPVGKPVQAAVRAPGGRILRLGPVVRAGPRSGFHDPVIDDDAMVRHVVDHAFRNGALASNGHNSIWNRIPDAENADARRRLLECGTR